MNICVYEARPDEHESFEEIAKETGATLQLHREVPSPGTARLAKGCVAVSITGGGVINQELLHTWAKLGVRFLSTRTVGYNHIDLAAAAACGIRVSNAAYPPDGVAEFTIMLMLMCLRNYKEAWWRGQINDFSLGGLEGRELGTLTVGIVGLGRIGGAVARLLRGFGAHVIAYSPTGEAAVKKEGLAGEVEPVSLEELFTRSDLITLHAPLTPETHHMIDETAVARMKRGVVIVNCARGELCDNEALIGGIESGHIGALGLDVVEGEEGIAHRDRRRDLLSNRSMAYLRQFRNVIMTQHMAFYTARDVHAMVECGVKSLLEMASDRPCATELTAQ